MSATRMPAPQLPAAPTTSSANTETSAGYKISWKQLFNKLIHFFLSKLVCVDNKRPKQVENLYYNFPISRSHIRLLQLLPHENEDAAIHCRLFCTALDSKGTRPYEALSYVWGSEDKPCSIFINGCNLAVGKNLYAALLHLRDHSIQRTIWIDAICINQGDKEEKGHQVQSMAKIYAKASRVVVWLGEKAAGSDQALEEIRIAAEEEIRIAAELSTRRLDNKAGILTLLQRPWFRRIWVLQEVAAARHILIKCGSAEIDGFAFCSGLNALKLFNELRADLRAQILSVTYLIRGAIFRPKYATNQSDNFSLNIRPLGELIEMYHTREATNRRDKVYALLGMSSDNPTAAGLFADYEISWKELFNKLIHFFLSELVSVDGLSDDKENAVIEGKGCILGEVSSVKRNAIWEDRQDVAITWRNVPSYICVKEAWGFCWTLPTTVKSVQKGDLICLLQGASRPTILRPYNDHWAVIIIAVSPAGDSQATTEDIKWSELLQSITVFPHDFRLEWDWDINPDKQQDKNNHDYFASILVPEHSKTGWEDCLKAATRIRNVRLVLQEVKQYGVAVKNLREETAVLERVLRSMSNLKKTCLGPEDSEKEDAKETRVNQLIEDKGQWTLLCLAAENGHETIIKLLLDTGKVNLHREELQTALWLAEQKGYKAIVKMLRDTGKVNADAKDENGQIALHRAAITGNEVVVQLLFETVEVDLHSKELQKVLHMAAENGQEAVVKLLLDTGKVDADAQDRDGQTALHMAARNG
ncbi:heterokaryon incompatibility protein-domain-containing protein, partial [Neurospora tetraspora]